MSIYVGKPELGRKIKMSKAKKKEGEDNNSKVRVTSMMFYFHITPLTIYLSFVVFTFDVIHANPYVIIAA
jgi:hypothetical protein